MPRGGRRSGAGRPKRNIHPRSRALIIMSEAVREEMRTRAMKAARAGKGKLALEVLRETMMWGRAVANLMMGQCEQSLQEGAIPAALDWLHEARKMWWFAHKCAKAILPYESARLAPIASAPPQKSAQTSGGSTPLVREGVRNDINGLAQARSQNTRRI
jgi:hypothetical protein